MTTKEAQEIVHEAARDWLLDNAYAADYPTTTKAKWWQEVRQAIDVLDNERQTTTTTTTKE
jgi:hypothetical protein